MEKRVVKKRKSRSANASKAKAAAATLPRSYLALIAEFPLRQIKSGAEYDRAAAITHRLALREGRLDSGEQAFLEVLEAVVEQYDRRHAPRYGQDVSPTQALRALVKQAGMSVSDLGELLGSKGAASELLSGKRKEPSKVQIAKLCARFKVDASLFIGAARVPATAA